MDILRLLDQLHQLAVDQPKGFMGVYWGLDTEETSMLIHKIRASLPTELKQAANTARESERILESAKEDANSSMQKAQKDAEAILAEARLEADRIAEQARLEQQRLLAESEILKLAKAQSEEIRNQADRDAVQLRRGAEKYAHDVLSQLEGVVGKVMTTIERSKTEIAPSAPS
ncbi:hypothetical protein EON79_06870, partial [bacterium]